MTSQMNAPLYACTDIQHDDHHGLQIPAVTPLTCKHAIYYTDLIKYPGTEFGARMEAQDLGCCPVCNCIARHQVGLRMERQLPEGELRLRRCMALCMRLQRLHDSHRILQPLVEVRHLSEGKLCLPISMILGGLCRASAKCAGRSAGCSRSHALLWMVRRSLDAQLQLWNVQFGLAAGEERETMMRSQARRLA